MSAPVIDSITFDKTSYSPGTPTVPTKVLATVKYHDPDAHKINVTGIATDAEGNAGQAIIGSFLIVDPVTLALTDDAGHTWTKVSDDGATAVYQTNV